MFLVHAFAQEDLDQGLVGYVALVGHLAQFVQHGLGQAQGDGPRGGFQLGKNGATGLAPVQVIGRVVGRPELALLVFVLEFRNSLAHIVFSLLPTCPGPRSRGSCPAGG